MKNETLPTPLATQIRADVLHIGYPKAASTFLHRYFDSHPEVTTDHNRVADVLLPAANEKSSIVFEDKPFPDKIHISREESVAESVCITGDLDVWRRYLYVPGAWGQVRNEITVDPGETALRIHRVHPDVKILLLIREQADWLQSAYKYVMSQLPPMQRSFADYCSTPSGIVFLQAGHFDQTIRAYLDVFGSRRVHVMRSEDIVNEPRRFAAELCAFIGVSERPLPQKRENDTNVQLARIQRFLPIIERLPRKVKDTLKPHASRLLPGGRSSILRSRDIRILRSIYVGSNERTEKLIGQLAAGDR